MTSLACVAIRAADNKSPGDISRNWDRIEAIIPQDAIEGVTLDPRDAQTYLVGLKEPHCAETATRLAALLSDMEDERDNQPLFSDASGRMAPASSFRIQH